MNLEIKKVNYKITIGLYAAVFILVVKILGFFLTVRNLSFLEILFRVVVDLVLGYMIFRIKMKDKTCSVLFCIYFLGEAAWHYGFKLKGPPHVAVFGYYFVFMALLLYGTKGIFEYHRALKSEKN